MKSLDVAPWQEEEEELEVDDMEMTKHTEDLTESSSDEATGRKLARRKNGGILFLCLLLLLIKCFGNWLCFFSFKYFTRFFRSFFLYLLKKMPCLRAMF